MKLDKHKIFSVLGPENLHRIQNSVEEHIFLPGENIINHGDTSDQYFIIKSGIVVVLKKMLLDELEQVSVLGVGEGFGEDAIINGTKQQVTVRALEKTVVCIVPRKDFDSILKPSFLEEVFPEDVEMDGRESQMLLDVRMAVEFEEEHIPGALNIPLDELNMNYSELDFSKEYYVYCLAGSRSAAAAFILSSKGYRVRNIKGGLMAWDGPLVEEIQLPNESLVPT